MEKNETTEEVSTSTSNADIPVCGIIMPIANTDGYPNGHWQDVYGILCESAILAGFKPNLVSFDNDVAVIQKRIVQNIYSNPIVICDISSRNANVMFELGMRLAFDKPTIIVKDELTPYSFDISPIEHLNYPTDLRYKAILEFKEKLSGKIKETHQKSVSDPNYTTFLKHYGSFEVVKIQEEEVPETKFILSQLNELKSLIIEKSSNIDKSTPTVKTDSVRMYHVKIKNPESSIIKNRDLLWDGLTELGLRVKRIRINGQTAEILISGSNHSTLPPDEWLENYVNTNFD